MEKYLAAAETDRRPGHRRRPASREAHRSRSITSKDRTRPPRRSAAPSKPRIASISTANTTSASACRASAAPTPSRSSWASGWTASCSTRSPVETKPSGLVYFNPYSEEEIRLTLPEGDHVFRAGFIDDDFVKTTLTGEGRLQPQEEQVSRIRSPSSVRSRRKTEKASRKKILICDPELGRGLRREDPHHPRAPRLPPSGDAGRKSPR